MAKERMVTRTINVTLADCMMCNVRTATVTRATLEVVGKLSGEALLAEVRKTYDDEENKVVSVITAEVEERLYGLPEVLFMTMGTLLPPRAKAESEGEEG